VLGFSLQPVEFIKIIVIIFLARYYSGVSIKLSPFKHLVFSGLGVIVFVILVMMQPDFGSALLLFFLWAGMLIVSGFKKKYLLIIAMVLLLTFTSGWFFFFKDYQKQRLMTFLDPSADAMDEGYNITQAMIAVGSGGLIGRGIGFGSQSQLKFLPESQNDFIFAVIAEELGFLGVSLVITFFGIIFYRLIKAARQITNDFGVYFLLGSCILLFIEMFINIGMNIGIMPVVGISLPFLSYGGSAIISSMVLIGICESIIIRSKFKY
jgi:rod shape determining protein RodA